MSAEDSLEDPDGFPYELCSPGCHQGSHTEDCQAYEAHYGATWHGFQEDEDKPLDVLFESINAEGEVYATSVLPFGRYDGLPIEWADVDSFTVHRKDGTSARWTRQGW